MILDSEGQTWGTWYWPAWLLIVLAAFLGPEIYALVSGNAANTLSAWVWRTLKITAGESVSQWSALDFLTFGVWLVLIVWLSFHFWTGHFR